MRYIEDSPRSIDKLIRLANAGMLSSKMSLSQSPHSLLGCFAWDAWCSLRGLRCCVGDCGRKSGCVLYAPGAHPGSHCLCVRKGLFCGEQLPGRGDRMDWPLTGRMESGVMRFFELLREGIVGM